MSVYFLARIRITDEQEYRKYLDECDAVFAKYNGRYLAVDRSPLRLEGDSDDSRAVLIEFSDKGEFDRWYYSEDYQRILRFRLSGALCESILIQGR